MLEFRLMIKSEVRIEMLDCDDKVFWFFDFFSLEIARTTYRTAKFNRLAQLR